MPIVGLDLAGVETRPTGFCNLTGTKAETCLLYTDTEILEMTIASNPQVVAIDAPYAYRPVENPSKNGQAYTLEKATDSCSNAASNSSP
jgi:predicted nuclease with RNAse H fold